jgi:hypothetical protein
VLPAPTLVGGVPLMVGGRFLVTLMENAGSAADMLPSLTRIRISENVPRLLGVPLSSPVDALKVAQLGLFLIV